METSYLRRSWEALKKNPGWWKTIAILTVVQLIPIFGQIVAFGYFYRWAREAAWGMDNALPDHMGDLGPNLKSGAIVFVTTFVWGLVIDIIYSLLSQIPIIGVFLALLAFIAALAAGMIVSVMALRAVIYDSFTPGFQINQAWDMAKREPKGLVHVFGVGVLFGVISVMLAMLIFGTAVGAYLIGNASTLALAGSAQIENLAAASAPYFVVLFVIAILIMCFVATLGSAIYAHALGCWMAQFEPAKWGPSQQPVPANVGPAPKPAAQATQTAPNAPAGHPQYTQPAAAQQPAPAPAPQPAPAQQPAPAAPAQHAPATPSADAAPVAPAPETPVAPAPEAAAAEAAPVEQAVEAAEAAPAATEQAAPAKKPRTRTAAKKATKKEDAAADGKAPTDEAK